MAEIDLQERVAALFQEQPRLMTLQAARILGVPEAEVIRHLPAGQIQELDASRWEEVLRALEPLGKLHVICSNGAVTLEAHGQFGNFSTWGEFFNVQTASLDMHIRYKNLGSIFAVEKPGHMDGVNTLSIQFFDLSGAAALKAFLTFGGKEPNKERQLQFEALRETFGKQDSPGPVKGN